MTIYLKNSYRLWLFCRAYINAGESLKGIASVLSYSGKGRNGFVRDMWIGKFGIPDTKIEKLCELANVKKSDLIRNIIQKEKASSINDWLPIILKYKEHKNPTPDIFEIIT